MKVDHYALFPTRLLTIQFPKVDGLNREVSRLFVTSAQFNGDFNMHPDALNLLSLASAHSCIARLGDMFLDGLKQWLEAERIHGDLTTDVVLFSNYAAKGDFTLIHNHNAEVVGIYYVQTGDHDRPPLSLPEPDGEYDYFAAEDGVLVLHDPRFNANLAALRSNDYVKVFPRPGLMLIFPGYLWHSVTPHLGDRRRLAISANFRIRWPETARSVSRPLHVDKA
jgi:hypothetical protein